MVAFTDSLVAALDIFVHVESWLHYIGFLALQPHRLPVHFQHTGEAQAENRQSWTCIHHGKFVIRGVSAENYSASINVIGAV